ncbi:hypothetical protein [Actinomadura rupiterrae]|uniref:hypothetical protein n=1 Tax=Actinomadura rupiterrae TaxID=559627 RepID=UPI0020A29510|nr:hypothetical protein [Actinomadura rupiterrae]MCP2336396.1 hypothetical protein [Actinomadura rupiterrae]
MPEDAMTKAGAESRYCELVRLAYLVLPGTEKRAYRLALARRIVDGAVAGRSGPRALMGEAEPRAPLGGAEAHTLIGEAEPGAHTKDAHVPGDAAEYERLRERVLRRAVRPSRMLRVGLGPWLRALPGRLPDPALTGALARMDAPVRVACVLRLVAGLHRFEVRDVLVGLGVRDPWKAIEEAERVRLPAPAVPFEPASARPVRRRSRLPVVAASVLTAGLLGALVVSENGAALGARGTHGLRLVSAAPSAWTRGPRTLDAWPARGDLASDRALSRAALSAWAAQHGPGRVGRGATQLLYAGHLDGRTVAVLRHGDRIARYAGPGRPLEVATTGADASAPVALGGGRYLLAPWDAKAAVPGGDRVHVQDGVTDPIAPRTRCGRGPVLDLSGPDGSRTVGDLGGARPVILTYRSPTTPPPPTPTHSAAAAAQPTPAQPAGAGAPSTGMQPTAAQAAAARPASAQTAGAQSAGARPAAGPVTAQSTAAQTPGVRPASAQPAGARPTGARAAGAQGAGAQGMPGKLGGGGLKLWDRLGCVLPQPARPVERADAADFWSGSVPHGGGAADWVCTRFDFAGGGSAGQAALVGHAADSTLSAGAGGCDDRRPVSGLWWRAEGGHWYYLAAAGRGLTPQADGPLRRADVADRLLVGVPHGDGKTRPDAPVTLAAHDE